MIRALYSAASGMLAQQTSMDTISNNLANVNTTGFKRARAEFQDLVYAHIRPPVDGDAGIMVGQGTRLSSIHRIVGNGALVSTGNPYDMAIQGQGFFRVQRADGTELYTRDGAFHLDGQRRLATATGELLLGEQGPITIPADAVNPEVTQDGVIRYSDSKGRSVVVDRVKLAVFANPSGMNSLGSNLWGAADASGQAALADAGSSEIGRITQGYLEGSNVQAVEEMVNLIMAQRAYEINSKAVQSADEMMGIANNLRRG